MNRDQQRLLDYLQHILEAIKRIQRYVTDIDEVSFLENELIQDAVIRNLEIIGEASRNITRHYPEYAGLPLARLWISAVPYPFDLNESASLKLRAKVFF